MLVAFVKTEHVFCIWGAPKDEQVVHRIDPERYISSNTQKLY